MDCLNLVEFAGSSPKINIRSLKLVGPKLVSLFLHLTLSDKIEKIHKRQPTSSPFISEKVIDGIIMLITYPPILNLIHFIHITDRSL